METLHCIENSSPSRPDESTLDCGRAEIFPRIDNARMSRQATHAAQFLKTFANPHRLLILCHLLDEECTVSTLQERLGMPQAHLSQQLARLRHDGLVKVRRESKHMFYQINSGDARELLATLYHLFCENCPSGAETRHAASQRAPMQFP